MNKQEEYWKQFQQGNLRSSEWMGALGRQNGLLQYDRIIAEQDAQIERLARRVADAELELTQTLRILSNEQSVYLKLVGRLCDALGTWAGKWDDAAIEAIKKSRK